MHGLVTHLQLQGITWEQVGWRIQWADLTDVLRTVSRICCTSHIWKVAYKHRSPHCRTARHLGQASNVSLRVLPSPCEAVIEHVPDKSSHPPGRCVQWSRVARAKQTAQKERVLLSSATCVQVWPMPAVHSNAKQVNKWCYCLYRQHCSGSCYSCRTLSQLPPLRALACNINQGSPGHPQTARNPMCVWCKLLLQCTAVHSAWLSAACKMPVDLSRSCCSSRCCIGNEHTEKV